MAKQKVNLKLRELESADVQWISIVKRGANRIPFRILKSEGFPMIDLGMLFRSRKAEKEVPVVVAIGVAKAEGIDHEGMLAAVKEAGYTVLAQEEADGQTVLKTEDVNEDTQVVGVQAPNGLTIVMKGISTWPEGTMFTDNLKQAGVFPGVRLASEILMETLYNIASDQEGTTEMMKKAVADFSTYCQGLMDQIPSSAMKAEWMEPVKVEAADQGEADTAAKTEDAPTPDESGTGETDSAFDTNVTDPVAKADEPNNDGGAPVAESAPEGESVAAKSDEVVAQENPSGQTSDMDLLLRKFETLLESTVGPVAGQVKALKDDIGTLTANTKKVATRLDEVERVAKSAEEAVAGTATSASLEVDGGKGTARKAESDSGLFDSAFRFDGFE